MEDSLFHFRPVEQGCHTIFTCDLSLLGKVSSEQRTSFLLVWNLGAGFCRAEADEIRTLELDPDFQNAERRYVSSSFHTRNVLSYNRQ